MDATIYLSVAIFLIVIIVIIGLLLNSKNKGKLIDIIIIFHIFRC